MLKAIDYDDKSKSLKILDQVLLPHKREYLDVKGTEDAWNVIHSMKVRGAPAIAIVGLLGLAVEMSRDRSNLAKEKQHLLTYLNLKTTYLCTSRPTAVNIRKESDALVQLAEQLVNTENVDGEVMFDKIISHIEKLLGDDLMVNKLLGDHGAKCFMDTISSERPLNVLTHCNTGSLATSGYGTALGVIRSLWASGNLSMAYCTETRPYNQGARLTAWELVQEAINGTLICDDMVAALMKQGKVDAVVVGADRVVANGDTANKIGTYQIAVLANYHKVPFYIASPLSTIDFSMADGSLIPIEERPQDELKYVAGQLIAPLEINCWNPAFDVTPASLISGIITEKGVFKPEDIKSLQSS
ncbi:Methylthioribose-1-phosphate isomerase [Halotydeus destructor]|nr:Methylthioribose-1-phosphate isomerase [Halotydeus destructor]